MNPKTVRSKERSKRHYLRYLFLIVTLLYSLNAFAQSGEMGTYEEPQKVSRPAYLSIAVGMNISSFRDFATSPLIYSGKPLYTELSYFDIDERRASYIAFSYSFGKYKSNFNQHSSESKVNVFTFNYLELFQLKPISRPRLNIKIGGQLNLTANHRENTELFNNREGVDIISTLFGSAKTTLGLGRARGKSKRSLFNQEAHQQMHTLSVTMNIGIVNGSYRNSFAYTSPSAPLNKDDFFAGYIFRIFEGFRLNSALDYTVFLRHKNAIQFSYLWDAYKTGGHHDNFEMATHLFKFSLLFRLK
jgi:hypothetical protein